jgi:ketosteroid isomerase-like protein
MTAPAPSPTRLETAQQFVSHIGRRDVADAMGLLAPDAVYQVPGRHRLAGTFRGPDAVLQHLLSLVDETSGTFETVKFQDWLVGENTVGALVVSQAQTSTNYLQSRAIFLLAFAADDKINEVTIFFQDEEAVERFFGA